MKRQGVPLAKPVGNIDGVFHHNLTGWFHCDGDPVLDLTLSVDGKDMLATAAELPRPDVEAHLGFGGKSGFSFPLGELALPEDADRVVELTLYHRGSGFNFDRATVFYCQSVSEWFNEIRDLFCPEYYVSTYSLFHLDRDQAFQHFIREGIFELKDPCPWFSNTFYADRYPDRVAGGRLPLVCYLQNESDLSEQPSPLFDPEFYRASNEDLRHVKSLLAHYSRYGTYEGRLGRDLSLPKTVRQEIDDISDIEPRLSTAIAGLDTLVRYPFLSQATYLPKLLKGRIETDIKAIVCVPFISHGGADLISTFLFRAYQQALGIDHVLMLVTDKASIDVPGWLDDGSQVVCLDDECTFSDDEEKLISLHTLIGRLAPEKVVNVNSHLTWRLFERYGRQLSSVVDLFAYLFCFDYDKQRFKVGYIPDYLPKTLACLKAVFFDNRRIVEDVKAIYGFSHDQAKKLHAVYVPAAEGLISTDYAEDQSRDTVLWVGRLSLQKRPDVLVDIAQSIPGQMFDVYGSPGNSVVSSDIVNGKYANIRYRGVYDSLEELDLTRYSCYLNTSEWDGLPTIIIQMMALGLPIVSSSVCGITELVNDNNGWLVDECDDHVAYVRAIRRVSVQKGLAIEKVACALNDVNAVHRWGGFYKQLESLNAFAAHESMQRVNAVFSDRRSAA